MEENARSQEGGSEGFLATPFLASNRLKNKTEETLKALLHLSSANCSPDDTAWDQCCQGLLTLPTFPGRQSWAVYSFPISTVTNDHKVRA